ncbi:MAG: TonB-dependent receptor [Chitinophagaceae bacterium]
MRTTSLPILFFILSFLLPVFASAQQAPKVSAELSDVTIAVFVQTMEQQTDYHFYYDSVKFDSLRINLSASNLPLQKVLELAFSNSEYHYALDEANKQVFLTRNFIIKTNLPQGFYDRNPGDTSRADIAGDYGDKKKVKIDATIESKLFEIGIKNNTSGKVTLAGYIRNSKTGEPITGASIFLENTTIGTSTDQYGYYSLVINKGRYTMNIQGIGMKDTKRRILLNAEGKLNIDMEETVTSLKEVIVSAQKVANVRKVTMGMEKLNIKNIKQMPSLFGEADVLRAVTTLPGVKTVGEASTGFNVRGGSADQNLILFNDATIFNPSHFFGFFSAFNPDVVKDVELYKSSVPPKYGGRLSSVLDITSREGNKKNITGTAGIGLLTSRVNIEGPIIKDKMSFIAGGRTTYADWLLNKLPNEYKNSKAGFYDVNLLLSYQINNKNNLYFTGYFSKDRFNLNSDTAYRYSNKNVSLKWKHTFTNKLSSVVTAGYDRYDYSISSDKIPINAYKLGFDIGQYYGKADFNWYWASKHTADFGVSYLRYQLHPGLYQPLGKESLVARDEMEKEQAQESAIYFNDRWNLTSDLSFHVGMRYSFYNYLGPKTVNYYQDGVPKSEETLLDTRQYSGGKYIKNYGGPEIRISARYGITNDFSIKAGYNSLRQYIHMLSNTTAISPTDIWKLSDPNIKPQYGDQISLGLYKNFRANTIETSVEVYYKRIKNYLDYKSGASLVMNHHIETDVAGTRGKAYGVEVMIKKQAGKLNGWLSYTYSRVLLKMDDPAVSEIVNRGEYYPANYDKPHDVTFVGNYKFSHRFSISLNATYSTGRPITLPIGRFYYAGAQRALYSDRNAYRVPDYFRTDFSMNIEGNHKVHQKTHNSWTIGVYNFLARKNPYSVYYTSENGLINGYKLSIFGTALPFINYNIRF